MGKVDPLLTDANGGFAAALINSPGSRLQRFKTNSWSFVVAVP